MKFATASEHRDFFRKHQLIEFENLLNPEQIQRLSNGINDALSHRLGIKPGKIKEMSPDKLFMVGRDIWRADPSLKKIILQSPFAEIVSELMEEKPVRIAYDQFFPGKSISVFSNKEEKYYQLIHKALSLNESSSFQVMVAGLMLCLSPVSHKGDDQPLSLFSSKAGNGIFFHPDLPIDFLPVTKDQKSSYLLIAYCRNTTVYCLNKDDPHTHDGKLLGYVFGDRLSDALNPVIYR